MFEFVCQLNFSAIFMYISSPALVNLSLFIQIYIKTNVNIL